MIAQAIIKKNGAVYTPENLAAYVAEKLVAYACEEQIANKSIHVIDPAVGDGILLENAAKALIKEKRKVIVSGTDITLQAIADSRERLSILPEDKVELHLLNTNALVPDARTSLIRGWGELFKETGATQGFDLLIANPPWGADISDYKPQLRTSDYTTLQGQFDSFELFMELAMKIVVKGGYFAFIIPDSILNHGKSILRNLIVEKTEIKFIARLGEKIFPRINRACVVMVCKNVPPRKGNMVDCFRLNKENRNKILKGELTFTDAEKQSVHRVPQQRFNDNDFQRFDIDLKEIETALVKKLKKTKGTIDDALTISRGVELGSSGRICSCDYCDTWTPLSEKASLTCANCGKEFNPKEAKQATIVSEHKTKNSVLFVRGSDLKRYVATPKKWLRLGYHGINYKAPSLYQSPKILVRKTGVGITAMLDHENAYTNQVVYIVKPKMKGDDLEFYIGLLNSRAYYFYLIKAFGELEWKSHPYLTQSQITSLPLPDVKTEQQKVVKQEIVKLLHSSLKQGRAPSEKVDARIEFLVSKLFFFTKKDYDIIFTAINESDELLPVKELKRISVADIFGK
jgi:hypothetical protein